MGLWSWLFGRAEPAPGWRQSEAGNDTLISGGSRVTVFQDGPAWKFCLANADGDDDPFFSETYSTKAAATHEALAMLNGTPSLHKTNQEMREERIAASIPQWIEKETNNLEAAQKSVQRLRAATIRKATTHANLRKRLLSGLRSAYSLRNHAGDDPRHSADAQQLIAAYDALLDEIAEIEPTEPPKT